MGFSPVEPAFQIRIINGAPGGLRKLTPGASMHHTSFYGHVLCYLFYARMILLNGRCRRTIKLGNPPAS